jgi:hypothetical protein
MLLINASNFRGAAKTRSQPIVSKGTVTVHASDFLTRPGSAEALMFSGEGGGTWTQSVSSGLIGPPPSRNQVSNIFRTYRMASSCDELLHRKWAALPSLFSKLND